MGLVEWLDMVCGRDGTEMGNRAGDCDGEGLQGTQRLPDEERVEGLKHVSCGKRLVILMLMKSNTYHYKVIS